MSLGLENLSDDQLLNLWKELYAELGTRLYGVSEMARQIVIDEREAAKVRKEALEKAIAAAKDEYALLIEKETLEAVWKAAKEGTIRLLTPDEEANLVVRTTIATQIAIVNEALDAIGKQRKTATQSAIPNINSSFSRPPNW